MRSFYGQMVPRTFVYTGRFASTYLCCSLQGTISKDELFLSDNPSLCIIIAKGLTDTGIPGKNDHSFNSLLPMFIAYHSGYPQINASGWISGPRLQIFQRESDCL
jgi:hypothetical protein